ncbi:MAG: phosphotransferase, partial [Bacteroidota bacterium]
MKIYTTAHISPADRQVLTALLGSNEHIEWLVSGKRPAVDADGVLTSMDYICNPDGSIRWLYPRGSRRPLFLSTYNSPTTKAKWYRRIMRTAFALRLQRFARNGRLQIVTPRIRSRGTKCGFPFDLTAKTYAIFTGTVGPNRKAIIALAVDKKAANVAQFAKVPVGPQAAQRLFHEFDAQTTMVHLGLRHWRVPQGACLENGATLVENIGTRAHNGGHHLTATHAKAIVELQNRTFNDSAYLPNFFKQIEQRLHQLENRQENTSLPGLPRLIAQLRQLFAETRNASTLPFAYAHGDFTPWNQYVSGDKLHVYDWEMAGPRPALFDLFHFVFQTGVLVQRHSYAEIRAELATALRLPAIRDMIRERDLDIRQLLALYLLDTVSYNLTLFQKQVQQGELHMQAWWLMRTWSEALTGICDPIPAQDCRKAFLAGLPARLAD